MLVGCGIRHAKRMCKRWESLKPVTPGERQAGPPRRSDGCGLGVAFACPVGCSEKLLQSFKGFKVLSLLGVLRVLKVSGLANGRFDAHKKLWPWGACWPGD